jgi:hypothetical protein
LFIGLLASLISGLVAQYTSLDHIMPTVVYVGSENG